MLRALANTGIEVMVGVPNEQVLAIGESPVAAAAWVYKNATVENAETFNNNLIKRVLNGSGPPSQSSIAVNAYIYEVFNEDKRPGPVSEKNWGLFFPNETAVYRLGLGSSGRVTGNSSAVFCVAVQSADSDKLQRGIIWACGQAGANCSAIQEGQPCYLPINLQNHASYAYNDYYQRMRRRGAFPPVAFGPVSPEGGSTSADFRASKFQAILSAAFLGLFLL